MTAITSAPWCSASQGIATELSSPPEQASTMRVIGWAEKGPYPFFAPVAGKRGTAPFRHSFRRVLLEPFHERSRRPRAARDNENRVVARDGADRFGRARAVERF